MWLKYIDSYQGSIFATSVWVSYRRMQSWIYNQLPTKNLSWEYFPLKKKINKKDMKSLTVNPKKEENITRKDKKEGKVNSFCWLKIGIQELWNTQFYTFTSLTFVLINFLAIWNLFDPYGSTHSDSQRLNDNISSTYFLHL